MSREEAMRAAVKMGDASDEMRRSVETMYWVINEFSKAAEQLAQAAYVNSQSVVAMSVLSGMAAENTKRLMIGESPAYDEASFAQAMQQFDLDADTVSQLLNRS